MIFRTRPQAETVDIDAALGYGDAANFSGGGLHPDDGGHALIAEAFLEEGATIAVQFGFGSTWQTEPDDIVWFDETSRVLLDPGVRTKRGASAARGKVDVGTCGLSLLNTDRRFDPLYDAGPYFGLLVPGVPVRVYITPEGQTGAYLFRGTVPSWPQRYDISGRWAAVPLDGFDGFDKLSRAKIPRSLLEKEIRADDPLGYWLLDEQSGLVMADALGLADGEYNAGATGLSKEAESDDGASVRGIDLDGDHYGATTQAAVGIGDRPCVVEALFVPHPDNSTGGRTIVASGTGASGVGLIFNTSSPTATTWTIFAACFDGDADNVAIGSAADITDALHHVAFRRPAAAVAKVYVDGVDVTASNSTATTTTAFAPGIVIGHSKLAGAISGLYGFVAHVAVYDVDIGAARLVVHSAAALAPLDEQTTGQRIDWILDELGWPATSRDLETGQTTLGPATFKPGDGALEYLRLIEATEDGLLFITADGTLRFLDRYWRYLDTLATTPQFTFSDTGTSYAEFDLDLDDELLINVARLTRRGGTQQIAADVTSSDQYGEAEVQLDNLLHRTDAETRALAEWKVATSSTPLPRIPKIRVPLHAYTAADQQAVLELDLGYRVTCVRTPTVGDPIELDLQIDGIAHTISNGEWWWEGFVSPVPEDTVSLFTLDTSTLDGADVLAY